MASKHKTAIKRTPGQDAIDLLMADHQRVAKLFAKFDALKEDGSDEVKSALVAQICRELIVHTAIEEEIFYPAVRKAIEDDDLMDEAIVEHAGAKDLIAQLQAADPDDNLYDAKVTVLGEQIGHHVEEEEGSMFPQAKASGIDTMSLGAVLLERKTELVANASSPPTMTINVDDDDDDDDARDTSRDDFGKDKIVRPKHASATAKGAGRQATPKRRARKKVSRTI